MTLVDSHCHLADDVFAADLGEVIQRARDAGVVRALVILAAGNAREAAQAARAHERWPEARAAIGVHPHQAHEHAAAPARTAGIVAAQLDATPYARAVGEIGLDYHYDFSPRDVQQAVFRVQVRLARERGLPVVIHTREADADTLAILREEGGGELRGVLHCFTGDDALAQAGLALGFFISASGIVTFPRSAALRETFSRVPLDRTLVETDSPFLAPPPFRGKRNEPAHVARVVETLAVLHRVAPEEAAQATARNFAALIGE